MSYNTFKFIFVKNIFVVLTKFWKYLSSLKYCFHNTKYYYITKTTLLAPLPHRL